MTSLKDNTPIKDFPSIYNENLDELNTSIESLNESIELIKGENGIIKNLKTAFNSAIGRIRAEYIQMFEDMSGSLATVNDRLDTFESKFEEIDNRLTSIEERLTTLEDRLPSDNTEDNQ